MAFAIVASQNIVSGQQRYLAGDWTGTAVTSGTVTCPFSIKGGAVSGKTSSSAPYFTVSGGVATLTFASGDGGYFNFWGV